MIRAIIAEDNEMSQRLLKKLLEDSGRVQVVDIASNGAECLDLMDMHELDAVFLDIEMPKIYGLDVAQIALQSSNPPLLVFITGHDEYAVKAFELAAVDYVVKTADFDAFAERVNTTLDRLEAKLKQPSDDVESIRETIAALAKQHVRVQAAKLPVKDYEEGTVRLLNPSEVLCAEREGRQVVLRTSKKNFPTYFSIDQLEERLCSDGFVRANRGALVNLSYVQHLIPNGDGSYDAIIRNEHDEALATITVSRGQSQALLKSLGM